MGLWKILMTSNDINVYAIENNYTREFHYMWDDIVEQLRKTGRKVNYIRNTKISPADFVDLEMIDCELLVEIDSTYKGISFCDNHGPISDFFTAGVRDNNTIRTEKDTLLVTHGKSPYTAWAEERVCSSVKCKVLEGMFMPQVHGTDFTVYREFRKNNTPIDKFAFLGNVYSLPRVVIPYLIPSEHFVLKETIGNPLEYFAEISKYKVGLCIPGVAELCHRDVEFLAMGIPYLKFEYVANLTPKLIPNYHYISIPRIDSHPFEGERMGKQEYADLYVKRFLEVKDDTEFLQFISKNAMEYYDTYLHPNVRIKHIFNMWELPFIE